jgi:DNA-3-methyladenine glycosylase II
MARPRWSRAAVAHLRTVDPALDRLIGEVGRLDLAPVRDRSPFESLVRAIAHQQLNGKAAETILRRFVALADDGAFPGPAAVMALDPAALRGAGFSHAKVAGIRDAAAKTLDGTVPGSEALARMSDDAIVERLVQVRGIGRWSVEMLLIFKLGRPDVLPVDDFGVRAGYRVLHDLAEAPTPKRLAEAGEPWRPYRSAAAWYLWRCADRAKASSPAPAV